MKTIIIEERNIVGQIHQTHVGEKVFRTGQAGQQKHYSSGTYLNGLAKRMFLPAGYPQSVSPDYLRYQILNALQAFCNSLAGLLSSRAILQGFGVGDPSATPTKALLLTVLQDVASRLTTIFSAHIFGSSLYPEAKTYRFLADALNDTAVILDTLSPFFNSLPVPGLRIGALCVSASFRSLCGICAGGSKAAISLHFSTPLTGKGDVGDLNAKDASKETVLALLGMLLGTLIVPRLTTPLTTYTALFILVGLHLAINYFGVRGLVLRSLNRQRLGIAWMKYRQSHTSQVPTPSGTANLERIFQRSGTIRDIETNQYVAQCIIGSSFSDILRHPIPLELFELFDKEHYLIWFDDKDLRQSPTSAQHAVTLAGNFRRVHICLKAEYTNNDLLKAWIHAVELCRTHSSRRPLVDTIELMRPLNAVDAIRTAYEIVNDRFTDFVSELQTAGWNTTESALMAGIPSAIITGIDISGAQGVEDKKIR